MLRCTKRSLCQSLHPDKRAAIKIYLLFLLPLLKEIFFFSREEEGERGGGRERTSISHLVEEGEKKEKEAAVLLPLETPHDLPPPPPPLPLFSSSFPADVASEASKTSSIPKRRWKEGRLCLLLPPNSIQHTRNSLFSLSLSLSLRGYSIVRTYRRPSFPYSLPSPFLTPFSPFFSVSPTDVSIFHSVRADLSASSISLSLPPSLPPLSSPLSPPFITTTADNCSFCSLPACLSQRKRERGKEHNCYNFLKDFVA